MCRPEHVDAVLRAFDEAGAQVGAVRAHGAEAKTAVRIVGPPDAVAACNDWATEYVLASTTRDPGRQEHVLGVDFGETCTPSAQFRRATTAVADLHDALAQVEDTAS